MRGVYPTLSHSLLLLLGLTAMSMIIFSVSLSLSDTERNLVSAEMNFFADSVKGKVLEAYAVVSQSNYTEGVFQLSLPEKVGNRKYSVTLYNGGLSVNTTVRGDSIEVQRTLLIDAEMNGTYFMPASIRAEKQDGAIRIGLVG